MPTILKRTLFVGLGGTGATALLHTKKRFLDTFGEIPPMIGFLVIDTDRNTKDKRIERENVLERHKDVSPYVQLENSEFVFTNVDDAVAIYNMHKNGLYNWFPEANVPVLRNMSNGAGQVRSNGRFSVFYNDRKIANALRSKIHEITNIQIADNTEFKPKGTDIEVNMVFSLAGGTGSGSFIDVAYLLRNSVDDRNMNVTAFAVLPEVFNAMQQETAMENTYPNTYGALMELDFLMQDDIYVRNRNLKINFNENPLDVNKHPFDVVFTINNTNEHGHRVTHISSISEQIGLSLFTGASELSANVDSVYDNIKAVLAGGNLDVEGKRAWACGMGVSELFYDGNTLSNIYANSVIALIINDLLNTDNESQGYANAFIDRDDVQIRENNDKDDLIDSLLSSRPSYNYHLNDDESLKEEIDSFLNTVKTQGDETIKGNYENRLKEIKTLLDKEVERITNSKCGVGNLGSFIKDFESQVNIFKDEMTEERQAFQVDEVNLGNSIESEISTLNGLKGGMAFLKGGQIRAAKEGIEETVNRNAVVIHELLRRDYAIMFYNRILDNIQNYKNNHSVLTQRLQDVKDQVIGHRNSLANAAQARQKTFVIDLHKDDLTTIKANKDDYIIADLVETLNPHNSIYNLYQSTTDTIRRYFINYTKTLNKANEYVNKTIDDVLREKKTDDLENIARQLINKSLSLWEREHQGYLMPEIANQFVIGLHNLDSEFRNAFQGILGAGQHIEFVGTGIKNKVTCYRMEAAVPVFAVSGVRMYADKYAEKIKRRNPRNYFIDKNWELIIEKENFSIWPKEAIDNSLPLWVMGLSYGYIRLNERTNKYEVYSLDRGRAARNYWVELSEYRDKAFEIFKSQDFLGEVEKLIDDMQKAEGRDATKERLMDIKENYFEKFLYLNMSLEDLDKEHNRGIDQLVDEEVRYTKDFSMNL